MFERAYCQTPVCGPSGASFLSGLRPAGERFLHNDNRVDRQAPEATTIPGYFRDHGYATRAYGKVFHSASFMAGHWTEPRYQAPRTNVGWRRYQTLANNQVEDAEAGLRGAPYEVAPDDDVLEDAHISRRPAGAAAGPGAGVAAARSPALVELVDVFPTLSELAGLSIPRQCEGNSLVPLLREPLLAWKRAVFTRFVNQEAVITRRHLYSAFDGGDAMCFDLEADPEETTNLARDLAHAEIVAGLERQLAAGWRGQRPDNTPTAAILDDLAAELRVRSVGEALEITVPNRGFGAPLDIALAPSADNGPAWRLTGVPMTRRLPPGAGATLALALEEVAGRARYPLPELHCRLTLAAPEGPIQAEARLAVPVVRTPPRFTVAEAPSPPAVDGRLDDPIWQAAPDVPLLGRMDGSRRTDPETAAWLRADEVALYVARAARSPGSRPCSVRSRPTTVRCTRTTRWRC